MVVTVPGNLEKTCQWVRSGPFCGEIHWIYEKGRGSWGAYVPDLPGVITVG